MPMLSDLLQKLSFDHLSELAIGGEGSGVIPEAHLPKVMVRFNSALTALYTRFPLQLRTIRLATVDGLYSYPLRAQFAQTSASAEINKFIQDTLFDPFLGDVLMVTDVYDSLHVELPLNDRKAELSWHMTSYDTLQMDYPKTGDTYFVQYRARHAQLPLVPADPSTVEILLPATLEEAFLAHAAGNIYGTMSIETALTKSQMLLGKYESECAFHEAGNTFAQSTESTNTKPDLRGWA